MDNGQPGSSERIINIKGLPNNIQVAQTLMQNKYVIVTVYYHYFIFILPVFDSSITSPCPDDLLFLVEQLWLVIIIALVDILVTFMN